MKTRHSLAAALLAFLLSGPARLAFAQAGSVDLTFNANIGINVTNARVFNPALQPDGKIVIAQAAGGVAVRLNQDGSADPAFELAQLASNAPTLFCTAIQADGKVLIGGGSVFPESAVLSRFNADGTPDPTFNIKLTATSATASGVRCIAILNDGRFLIGGGFSTVAGKTRNGIARLQPDGTLDAAFNPNASNFVCSIAMQPDGKAVIGGEFTGIGGIAHKHIARLNPDGSVDSTFNPVADNSVYSVALQADGRILIGGLFATVNGVARSSLARLNADGRLDMSFSATDPAINWAWSTALQANGQILVVGSGHQVTRLNANGSNMDQLVFSTLNGDGRSLCLQADGKVVVGGSFTKVNSVPRNYLTRLNNDLATQALSVPDAGQVRWQRGGTSPEAQAVTFELSTDGGGTWTPLGFGVRIAGGWALSGLNLPVTGIIRARARTATGYENGSSSLLETVHAYVLPAPPTVTTLSPYSVDFSSAKLDGTVNPNGAAGTWHFEYGADPTLAGASSTPTAAFAAGTADLIIGGAIAGLAPASVYYCRAVAISANGTTPGEIVAFTTTGTPGDLWRYQHFGAAWQGGSFAADYDGDGLSNLAEYAFGGDPLAPDSAAILPKIDAANGHLRITFTRDPAHTDITYLDVEASNDLLTWTTLARSAGGATTAPSVSGVTVSETALGPLKTVQVTDNIVIGTAPLRALRVKVSR